jgi:hypothetical protein
MNDWVDRQGDADRSQYQAMLNMCTLYLKPSLVPMPILVLSPIIPAGFELFRAVSSACIG